MSTAAHHGKSAEARKQELLSLLAKGSTDKAAFEELRLLNEAEERSKHERQGHVDDVVKRIAELGIRFSEVAQAFPDDQIREFIMSRGISWQRRRSSSPGRPGSQATRRDGEVLIEALNPKRKGTVATYNRGQRLPRRVPMAFKALLESGDALLEGALAARFTEAGKAYFATDQGKVDLAEFTSFVRKGKAASRASARR